MKKYSFFLLLLLLLITSCEKKEHPIPVLVSDVELIDIGRVNRDFEFEITRTQRNTPDVNVRIKTIDFRKYERMDTVICSRLNNKLYINVRTIPLELDEWWNIPDSLFTMHEVYFTLHDIPGGTYDIDLSAGIGRQFNYYID